MKGRTFLHDLKAEVKMVESNEQGSVIGRAEYLDHSNSYLVRYRAGDGRQVEAWFDEPAITAA